MKLKILFAFVLIFLECGVLAEETNKSAFRFAGGEQIQIELFGESVSEFANQNSTRALAQLVTEDGFVSAPAAGTVNIKGLTLQEATTLVLEKIRSVQKLKTTPQISISILSLPSRWVYIQGEVGRPMQLEMPRDKRLYLSSVLAASGGATPNADLTRIQVIRGEFGNNPEDVIVDMSYSKNGKIARGPVLESGDIVFVPPSESFSVIGEVNRVGLFARADCKVKSGNPVRLSDALSAAGGPKASADMKSVKVLSNISAEGEPVLKSYDVETALDKGDRTQDPVLKDGDKVMVGSNNGYMLMGRVRTPGIFYPPGVGGSPMTVSKLIALGGGFETYAKKSTVVVVHPEKRGKTSVDVKAIIEDGKIDQDVVLLPGDIVFVGESKL